jgi:hypothetical protein
MPNFTTEQLNEMVNSALARLKKDRDKEVLMRRGGINVSHQTLEQIGRDLNITRERVRQIEKAALAKIRELHPQNDNFTTKVDLLLKQTGGLISLSSVSEQLKLSENQTPHAIFLIRVNPNMLLLDRNDHHNYIIGLASTYTPDKIQQLHKALIDAFKTHGKPTKFINIVKYIDGPHSLESLTELATASNYLTELDGNWGLISWPEVNPKNIRDKIYLVLKRMGRPLHFSEIARKISELTANPKKVTTQAVHNELIKDERFVLIGRGIYALAEWGYRSGTVADIIEEILREEGGALPKDEIVKRVLARRQVKSTTIVLNLQEKPQFKRVKKGVYALVNK